jgi:hypothetical protein
MIQPVDSSTNIIETLEYDDGEVSYHEPFAKDGILIEKIDEYHLSPDHVYQMKIYYEDIEDNLYKSVIISDNSCNDKFRVLSSMKPSFWDKIYYPYRLNNHDIFVKKIINKFSFMSWKKALAYGLLMWIIMFAVVSLFIAIGISEFTYTWIITALVAGLLGSILGMITRPKNLGIGLAYALVWVAIGVILDAAVTRYFAPDILTDWTLWVGYGVFFVGVVAGSLGAGKALGKPMANQGPM